MRNIPAGAASLRLITILGIALSDRDLLDSPEFGRRVRLRRIGLVKFE